MPYSDGRGDLNDRLIGPLPGWWHRHDQIKRRIPARNELYGRFGNRIDSAFVASVLQPEDEFTEFRAFCVELRVPKRVVSHENRW